MNHKPTKSEQNDLNRRSFLRSGSMTTLIAMMGGVALKAEDEKPKEAAPAPAAPEEKHVGPSVNCAVIGCGIQGREIINTLMRLPNAPVVAVCDTYEPFLRRGKEAAPNAVTETAYKKVLAQKDVQAVIVATPSHQHKEIVLEALKAGKHVYCEAPLAHSVEDARAIAQAAKAAYKVNFQAGLQMRSEPQRHFLLQFIRSGAMGKTVKGRAQWQKKQSWRRTSPNPDREREINWRLKNSTSPGLIGEIGIHQVDVGNWFMNERPSAVTGFGSIIAWQDGRDVPDTIQAVFTYPSGAMFSYECTLANSFDADYEMLFGTDSAVMLRQNKSWMFKEVDSPLLGWEVYARKDEFYKETGIALVANATKLASIGGATQAEDPPYTNTPLSFALESFVANTGTFAAGVEDFIGNFGENEQGLRKYIKELMKTRRPAATYRDGLEATVVALKANEAILQGKKIELPDDLFEV